MNFKVRREDVSAAWSGIRPLVSPANTKDTASISRDHTIEILDSGLITIVGTKFQRIFNYLSHIVLRR